MRITTVPSDEVLIAALSGGVAGAVGFAFGPALAPIARLGLPGMVLAGGIEGAFGDVAATVAVSWATGRTLDAGTVAAAAVGGVIGGGVGGGLGWAWRTGRAAIGPGASAGAPAWAGPSTAPRSVASTATACSFSGDTAVATADGAVPISAIESGNQVLAYNGATDTYTVTATWAHTDPVVTTVTLDGEEIDTTPEHPFYVLLKGWVLAGQLQVGDSVRRADGSYGVVAAVVHDHRPQVLYNLTVAEAHTYFVGDGQWLVHNDCDDVVKLYHATTDINIQHIRRKIDLSHSRLDLDFNPAGRRGFYVTNNYVQAETWSRRLAERTRRQGSIEVQPAIVAFHVPRGQLEQLNSKVLVAPDDEWAQFVVQGRHGMLQHTFDYDELPDSAVPAH